MASHYLSHCEEKNKMNGMAKENNNIARLYMEGTSEEETSRNAKEGELARGVSKLF